MVLHHWTRWLPCPYMYMIKHFFSRTKKALRLNLSIQHWDSKSTKFVQMMILGWPLTFLRYAQMCVLVAVAILEEVAWCLQICNNCFYQVGELWPMGLLFIRLSTLKYHCWHANCSQNCSKHIITKTRLFKYIENFTTKNWNFQIKRLIFFHVSVQNIDCGYTLEPPCRGGSNEYPQSVFFF